MICPRCGKDVDDGKFCPHCGSFLGTNMSEPLNTSSLDENVAGLISYALGWITGIIFLFIDKRQFVRFHAMQSIVVFGGLTVVNTILGSFTGFYNLWFLMSTIMKLIPLLGFVLWVLLMVKAYQKKYYKLPIAGDLAEKFLSQM